MVIATYTSIRLVVAVPLNRLVTAIKNARDDTPISVNWSSRDEIGLAISEFQSLQDRQFRSQSRLRDELERSEKISADLRVMKDAAEQASRAKSEFLATMSHELRTPLNAIIGLSDFIKGETLGPVGVPQYVEFSRHINESGAHLLSIINDILDMSKIEAGEMTLEEAPFDVAETISGSVDMIAERAARENIELTTEIPSDLPLFMGDERMMKQILVNLLSNAVKFTPEHGKVAVTASADDDGFQILVGDTGIGIPPDKIDVVLQPFGQADSSLARAYEGTGLGLPLVAKMTELHGGTLSIDSVVGEGTRVAIRFPRDRIHHAANGPIETIRTA